VLYTWLLLKLQAYGNLLKWIEDYLPGRQQKVIVRNEESEWCDVISGVSQGSVLGPLLYKLNDLPEIVKSLMFSFC